MARREKSYQDLWEQRERIRKKSMQMRLASTDKKRVKQLLDREKRADNIMSQYGKNIEKALGYKVYKGEGAFNIIGRRGESKGLTIKPLRTLAKSKADAEKNFRGDRFTWQNGERYLEGSTKEGDPFDDGHKRVYAIGLGMSKEDDNKKLPRSAYTGHSDAFYANRRTLPKRPSSRLRSASMAANVS